MPISRWSSSMLLFYAWLACIALITCLWLRPFTEHKKFSDSSASGAETSTAAVDALSTKYFRVATSTISGAGLGAFARRDLPAGFVWSPEDADDAKAMAINLPLWQSLLGVLKYAKALGIEKHPLHGVYDYFDFYGFLCEDPQRFVVSLTGTIFTNHAPTPTNKTHQHGDQQLKGASIQEAQQQLLVTDDRQRASAKPNSSQAARYANCGDVPPSQAHAYTAWQRCTVSYTLRSIKAGEELLEDYDLYSVPCKRREDCPYLYKQHPAGYQLAGQEWLHSVLAKLQHAYVGNRTGPNGGLGVFAAHDMPAGFVWNKGDAGHAWSITRNQWEHLLQLQKVLKAAGVSKPVVNAAVDAFRASGYCCPLDGRLYLVFSPSTTANLAPGLPNAQSAMSARQKLSRAASNSGSKRDTASGGMKERQVANSMLVFLAEPGMAQALTVVEGCTWRQTITAIKKGEEILETHNSKHTCNWPGFYDTS